MVITKKKIILIFIISIILSLYIYNLFDKKSNILVISDNKNIVEVLNLNNLDILEYYYDEITYKELINNIKNNDRIIIKDKIIYLNQLISSSDIIIININNNEYFNKCKKNNIILNNYDSILSLNINDLKKILDRISNAKVYIVGNYCKNKDYNQYLDIPYEYIKINKNI